MTKADKEMLLMLVTRTGMVIQPVEAASAVNYIHGYEWGTGNKCDFTTLVKQLLSDKYKVDYSSDGWPGQIKRLAKKRHSTWLIVFSKITLEILANTEGGRLDYSQQKVIRERVESRFIDRIVSTGYPWFGDSWVEDWLALCDVKSNWFKQLWNRKEWTVIRAIDKLVQTNGVFRDEERQLPSPALLALKSSYGKVTSGGKALGKAS